MSGKSGDPEKKGASRELDRILIVEDDQDLRETLATMLELLGHPVIAAANGHSALQLAEVTRPDVALIDIGLPDMSGHDVARQLRAGVGGRKIRLIALTGYSAGSERDEAHRAGFDAFAVKPVGAADLQLLLGCRPLSGSR